MFPAPTPRQTPPPSPSLSLASNTRTSYSNPSASDLTSPSSSSSVSLFLPASPLASSSSSSSPLASRTILSEFKKTDYSSSSPSPRAVPPAPLSIAPSRPSRPSSSLSPSLSLNPNNFPSPDSTTSVVSPSIVISFPSSSPSSLPSSPSSLPSSPSVPLPPSSLSSVPPSPPSSSITSLPPSSSLTSIPPSPPTTPQLAWKEKKDMATGRTYYYNTITNLSTWKMPVEVLKQVKPDDTQKLQSLSGSEFARWARISLAPLPPPSLQQNKGGKPLFTPLQVEEMDEGDIISLNVKDEEAKQQWSRAPSTSGIKMALTPPPPPPLPLPLLPPLTTTPIATTTTLTTTPPPPTATTPPPPTATTPVTTTAPMTTSTTAPMTTTPTVTVTTGAPSQQGGAPPPPPPRKTAPRRSPSQPIHIQSQRFVPDPDSPPLTPTQAPHASTSLLTPTSITPTVSPAASPRVTRTVSAPLSFPCSAGVSSVASSSSSSLSTINENSPRLSSDSTVEEKVAFHSPSLESLPPPPFPPSPQLSSNGWLLLKDEEGREYQFKPSTGEMFWIHKNISVEDEDGEDNFVPPPPEEEQEEEEEEEELPPPPPSPNTHKKSSSERLSRPPPPPISLPKQKAQSLFKTDTSFQVFKPKPVPKEMMKFIEEVMRPKYGQGQLLKDPDLLKPFFVYLINIPENLRHVVFHEFFLGVFWREEILEQLLNFGSWKQWLLILIAEATVSQHEILEYVLMTLIEMFNYFFRKFSPRHNGIRQVHENRHLNLDFSSSSTSISARTMADFLFDALSEIDKQSDKIVSYKALSGLNLRICSWDRKPGWARPDFSLDEWPNLVACLEGQEDYLFFPLPKREFCMPEGGLDFLGLPVLESIVVLFEKMKVQQLAACEETMSDLVQLQKFYSTRAMQDFEFFKGLRDFFRFYGTIDCMELQKTGFHVKAKVPARCTANEIVQLFANRKRQYGGKVQKKVVLYLNQVNDHYRKVFAGEIPLPVTTRPAVESVSSPSSKTVTNWI